MPIGCNFVPKKKKERNVQQKNWFYLMEKKKKEGFQWSLLCVGVEPSQNAKVECVFLDITIVVVAFFSFVNLFDIE